MASKARVIRGVIDRYFSAQGIELEHAQEVDNPAMVMSLVASTRGLTVIPAYVENLMPWSVTSRPLAGMPPTVELCLGYRESDTSSLLRIFLSRIGELRDRRAE